MPPIRMVARRIVFFENGGKCEIESVATAGHGFRILQHTNHKSGNTWQGSFPVLSLRTSHLNLLLADAAMAWSGTRTRVKNERRKTRKVVAFRELEDAQYPATSFSSYCTCRKLSFLQEKRRTNSTVTSSNTCKLSDAAFLTFKMRWTILVHFVCLCPFSGCPDLNFYRPFSWACSE